MITYTKQMKKFLNKLQKDFMLKDYSMFLFSTPLELGLVTLDNFEQFKDNLPYNNFLNNSIQSIPKEETSTNPYYKNIKINQAIQGNYVLANKRIIPKNTLCSYDEMEFDPITFDFKPHYFACNKYLHCPMIKEKDSLNCWMSVEPFEINSFKKTIDEAHGNVLLIGLGLGYLAYMLSEKEDVNSITVVELQPDIINLFKNNILNQFPNKNKINIINDNGIDFINNHDLSKYNCINTDIWLETSDMLPYYLSVLPQEKIYQNTKFSYWLEKELKTEVQKSMIRVATGLTLEEYSFDVIARQLLSTIDITSKKEFTEALKLNNFRNSMLELTTSNPNILSDNHISGNKEQVIIQYQKTYSKN